MELIAHRAGNRPETVARALERTDRVELDAHVFRGRVELRHAKVLWPTSRLWERWYLLPRTARGVPIAEVLKVLPPRSPLLVDLKCFTGRAARRIRDSVPDTHPVVASTRSWWILRAFRNRAATVRLRSCGTRRQLRLALALPGLGHQVGIVAHERILDQQTIAAIKAKTPILYSWAIPGPERGRELVHHGVTGLIVDDLELEWPKSDPV